jgi:hypothetical protein
LEERNVDLEEEIADLIEENNDDEIIPKKKKITRK